MRSGRTLFKFHLVTSRERLGLLPSPNLVKILIGQGLVVAAILLLEGVGGRHAVVKMRFFGCRGNQTGIGQGQNGRGPGKSTGVIPIGRGIVVHLVA